MEQLNQILNTLKKKYKKEYTVYIVAAVVILLAIGSLVVVSGLGIGAYLIAKQYLKHTEIPSQAQSNNIEVIPNSAEKIKFRTWDGKL